MARKKWKAQGAYIGGRAAITLNGGSADEEHCLAGTLGEIWEDGRGGYKVWCINIVSARAMGFRGLMAPEDEHVVRIGPESLKEALGAIRYSPDPEHGARLANRRY